MTSYQYTIGSQSVSGALTWNPNGTLSQLAITDPINTPDQQTCSYGYDDLARLASANCGSIWNETFSYDAFGNITKNAISGAYSWQPTYTTSPPTNQYAAIAGFNPPYYDLNSNNQSNGNVIKDGSHNYAWDADGNPVTIDSIGLTFDALDRMVEQYKNGSYNQIVYGPTGNKLGLMNGQTISRIRVPYPGGGLAVYTSGPTFLMYWRSPDWRGSMPFGSDYNHTVTKDSAFAPFGEEYAWNPGGTDVFTGQLEATTFDVYDFPYREYPSIEGRWLTPDPAGLAAVNPANPQSWNRYAYVLNNPLALVDPLGLTTGCWWVEDETGEHQICLYPGGGGGGGGGPCSLNEIRPGHFLAECGHGGAGGGGGGGGGDGGSGNGGAAANNIDRSRSCFGIFANTAFQPLEDAADTASNYLAGPAGSPSPSQYAAMAGVALQQGGFSLTSLSNTVGMMVQAGAASAEDAAPAISAFGTAAALAQSASTYLPAAAEYVMARAPVAALAVLDYQLARGLAAEINAAKNGECGGDK